MNIVNTQWQNFNGSRSYPLEDSATKIDDTGKILQDDIIVDLNLWVEASTYQGKIFVSSVAISPGLVSITISGDNGGIFNPLATLTIPRPVTKYRNYAMTGLTDSVAGWVAFGNGIDSYQTLETWRFSSPTQTAVLPSNATQFVRTDLVTSLGKLNRSESLVGDVILESTAPDILKIEYVSSTDQDAREINGNPVDAIVFRLNLEGKGAELLKKYLGPCDVVPESGTCMRPPIFGINSAIPNCSGVIDLFFSEVLVPQLGTVFVVENANDENALDLLSNIGQGEVCAFDQTVFLELCSSTCIEAPAVGPFASYNRIYGGSL